MRFDLLLDESALHLQGDPVVLAQCIGRGLDEGGCGAFVRQKLRLEPEALGHLVPLIRFTLGDGVEDDVDGTLSRE